MIQKINFCGRAFFTTRINQIIPEYHKRLIQREVRQKDYDVFIYSKDRYADGSNSYTGIAAGKDVIWNQTFSTRHDYDSFEKIGRIIPIDTFKNL